MQLGDLCDKLDLNQAAVAQLQIPRRARGLVAQKPFAHLQRISRELGRLTARDR
jgi:hypothetical protein